ncbi:MAG: hypothetical protein QOE77_4291 [Blastocatellia bacterium]|nr:hypothetical protein [Blastocatellia bacterium]
MRRAGQRRLRRGPALLASVAAGLGLLAAAGPARVTGAAPAAGPMSRLATSVAPARRAPLAYAIQDDAQMLYAPGALAAALAEIRPLGFTHVRLTAHWDQLAPAPRSGRRPRFDAADPGAYEQARWAGLDRAVRAAVAEGLRPMVDVGFFAPRWATRGVRRDDPRPRNRIDPGAFRDFALAVALRYAGDFTPPGADRPLPRVDVFTLWNEPNLGVYFTPQRAAPRNGRVALASPRRYAALAGPAYREIKLLRPEATVLVGALASGPAWSPTARQAGIPALRFLREMACVDDRLAPLRTAVCRGFTRIPGDGLAVHVNAMRVDPASRPAGARADTLTMGNLDTLSALLGRLAARGRISPRMRDVYVTEFGYLTPHVGRGGATPGARRLPVVSLAAQARYTTTAHYLAWRVPRVRMFAQFLVRDTLCDPLSRTPCLDWPSGLYTATGRAKPVASELEATLRAWRRPGGGADVWVRLGSALARRTAALEYLAPDGSWQRVERRRLASVARSRTPGILTARLRSRPGPRLRLAYRDAHGPRVSRPASVDGRPQG